MSDGSIAIVGASCRFPGAEDLEGFWRLLASGTDAVSQVDPRRWSTKFFYHPDRSEPGKSYTWSAGLIDGVDLFEPSFFGISPREAAQMDPQQRVLLELVWHAFEDAGIRHRRLYRRLCHRLFRSEARRPGRRRLVLHDREHTEHPGKPHFLHFR